MSDIEAPVETEGDEDRPASRPTMLDVYWLIGSEEGTSRPIFLTYPPPRLKKSTRGKRANDSE